jgi:hypothetical protein
MADRFDHLSSVEAETSTGVWNWAKRLVTELNRLRRLWELADADLTGKAGYKIVVRADENGYELVP